jgi:PhnB protein
MQLNPYLNFNGQCEAAFKFYEECFGGKIQTLMTWGDSPMADQVPTEWREKIIHTSLIVGDTALLGTDAPPIAMKNQEAFQ